MVKEPKGQKHHYIPVFYLKQWMNSRNNVCEYSRPYDVVKPRWPNPDGTGYERGLYAINDPNTNVVNAIEDKFLKPSDGAASDALQCLLREAPFTRPVQMRHAWARFVMSLLIRYPEAITRMKKDLRENVEKLYLRTRKFDEPQTFAEYEAKLGTNELARVHGKLMMDLMLDSKMGRLIFEMHWGIFTFTNHKHELLTSDRPVVSNQFPISANHMCLPISPTVLFVACGTQQAENEFRALDAGYVMGVMNDLVAKRARKFVWGRDDSQLRFVENRLGKSDAAESD